MTDVREMVAALLFQHDHPEGNWSAYIAWTDAESKEEVESYRTKADSVLSALGWEKMREALERCERAIHRIGANFAEFDKVTDDAFWDGLWNAEKDARSALSLSNGGEDKT